MHTGYLQAFVLVDLSIQQRSLISQHDNTIEIPFSLFLFIFIYMLANVFLILPFLIGTL